MSQAPSEAGSRIRFIASVSFSVAAGISVIAGVGWITSQLVLAQAAPWFVPMAPFAILFFLLLCASYSLHEWRPSYSWVRMVAGVGALLVTVLSSAILLHFWTGAVLDVEEMIFQNLETISGYGVVNISPIAAMLLFLGAVSFILLILIPRELVRSLVAMCGISISCSGLVMTVAYVYSAQVLYGSAMRPVAFPAAVAFLCLGIGIWASAGPACWPTRELIGESVRARLLRAFLPATSLILTFFLLLETLVVQNLAAAPLVRSLELLLSLVVVIAIISRIARTIGGEIDQAQETLSRTLEELHRSENQLRSHSEHLEELVEERTRGLSESERRYRELAELLPGIVFETDENGNITLMNRSGLLLLGYTTADINGGLNWSQLYASQERNAVQERFRLILTGGGISAHEHTAMRKNGTTFPIIMHSAPIIKEGRPVGLRGIAIDITDRNRIEAELAKSRRLAAIGETAAIVGHDLRNPLQGISTATHLLKKKLGPMSDESIKRMLSTIEKGIEHSDNIIGDLLDFSREIRLQMTESDSKSLTMEALSFVRVPANIKVLDMTQHQPKFMADRQKITRVFVNIIQNAVEAMPEGGTLTITTSQSDGNVEITFSDTGVGMTEETMAQIWGPLFTTKSRGIGLGLPGSKRVMEAHQGSVSVESTPGKGSKFIVSLPRILSAEA